ncbi:MAG: 16S rRNA (uracil(1498)-N(3))-methyltransferase [Candidatus Marinarcus sp.]|uniref:16S rRNA (uracil(1498)-N(3))-methyltransferase n=1 Tax=Candidatus Marinarcus sp. TaxID=3100987 RepID=UPI003B00CA18
MQFIYHELASQGILRIDGETYKYLFKVRRHTLNDILVFRNMQDGQIYFYKVEAISKRDATLTLQTYEEKEIGASVKLHMGWCVVDPKTIEKQLPYLNELGVEKLTFIYADFSQKNFKINIEKLNKILINSSQQCGRSSLMQLDIVDSLDTFLNLFPEAYAFNFSEKRVDSSLNIQTIVVGCEGGFSKREVELFSKEKIVGIHSDLILRSETAMTTVAAKLIV